MKKSIIFFVVLVFVLELFLRSVCGGNLFHYYSFVDNFHLQLDAYTNLFGTFDRSLYLYDARNKGIVDNASKCYRIKKPNAVKRVVCLGTSSTIGVGALDRVHNAYPRQLEKRIHAAGFPHYEVFNGAIGGVDLTSVRIYFEEVLIRLDPDIVILYFGANGVDSRTAQYYTKARDYMRTRPFIKSHYELVAAMDLKYSNETLFRIYYFLLTKSRLFFAFKHSLDYVRGFWVRHQAGNVGIEEELALCRTNMDTLIELCSKNNISFVVVPELVFDDKRVQNSPVYTVFKERVRAWKSEFKSVYFFDLLTRYAKDPNTLAHYFSDTDGYKMHLTDEGYIWLAGEIAEYIKAQGIL